MREQVSGVCDDEEVRTANQSSGQLGETAEDEAPGDPTVGTRTQHLEANRGGLTPLLRGWINYFRLAEVKVIFEELDGWIRRKLRCVIWRQWKRTFARAKGLMKRGLDKEREISKDGGMRGHRTRNEAFPKSYFNRCGLVSLLGQRLKLQRTS
jgi:RNA-directed DNA polymerase